MEPTLYKTIELENGQILNIWDTSRAISSDAHLVRMKADIEIEIQPELFSQPLPENIRFEHIQKELGNTVTYAYEVERNFILNHEKEAMFQSLVDTFLSNLGQYVAKPVFPGKFVLKTYQDKIS